MVEVKEIPPKKIKPLSGAALKKNQERAAARAARESSRAARAAEKEEERQARLLLPPDEQDKLLSWFISDVNSRLKTGKEGWTGLGVYTLASVKKFAEMVTGQTYEKAPKRIVIPLDASMGRLVLSRSSKYPIYYRTTVDSCTCPGWFHSSLKGKPRCRHHREAFPADAAANDARYAAGDFDATRVTGQGISEDELRGRLEEAARNVANALEAEGLEVRGVRLDGSAILIRIPYKDEPDSEFEDAVKNVARSAAPGLEIVVSAIG